MPRLKLPACDIYYEDHGAGRPVLFLHGSGGNHLSWWRQLPDLSRDHRCIIYDQPGYGFSKVVVRQPPESPVDHMTALLDMFDLPQIDLVGQSIGGHLCFQFALLRPERVRRLVLADTLAGISDQRIATAKAHAGTVPPTLIERALSSDFRAKHPDLTLLYAMIEQSNHANGSPPAVSMPEFPPSAAADVEVPTLLLAGEHDPVAPVAALTVLNQMMPRSRLCIIPGAGHSAYFEQPKFFNAAVRDFLAN